MIQLNRCVDELELSVRTANNLKKAKIVTVGDLMDKRAEARLLKTPGFGRRSLKELKEILDEMGLSLGMTKRKALAKLEKDEKERLARIAKLDPEQLLEKLKWYEQRHDEDQAEIGRLRSRLSYQPAQRVIVQSETEAIKQMRIAMETQSRILLGK